MYLLKPHVLSLGTTLLVVGAIGIFSALDWHTYDNLARSAEHARTAVAQAGDLLSLLTDAETGDRGFLLTGDERYLEPYNQALPAIAQRLQYFNGHPANSESPLVDRMVKLTRSRLEEMADTIAIRRSGNAAAATAAIKSNRGKATMDQIRAAAAQFIDLENRAFMAQEQLARSRGVQLRIVVLGGTAVLALLLLGAVIHVTIMIADLERAHTHESSQKATLSTTLESIGDAVIATDAAGVITLINPVAQRLTGWSGDSAAGRPLDEVMRAVCEETGKPIESLAEKILQQGSEADFERHRLLQTRDGREVPIDDSAAAIRDHNGNVTGVVLVFRDVTARRKAERDLADSERRYRLLFESNPEPMWVYEQQTLRFLAVNNAAVDRYGYTREEFLRMTLQDIRPPEEVPKLLQVTSVPPTKLHIAGTWVHRKKDGGLMEMEITQHPLSFDGHDACLVLATDVTERRRLERQFYQSQRIESVGRLAGGVAHDFNNLLTVINGYSDMLLGEAPADGALRDGLLEIRAAGDRAASLTQQLLAFSRRQIIQPTVLNLNRVVSDLQKMLQRLIGEDIEFVTMLSPDLGNIEADEGQLQQVIMNLAVNARDAMPGGGRLVIETANVAFDEAYARSHADTRPGAHVMLAVSDSGTGMAPEVKEHIFEPFFTTKPTGTGTGLGLATVYGMVKQSGGWIWLYTEPGSGTTFKLYFPRTDVPATVHQAAPPGRTAGTETILVVEDQKEVRNLAVAALRQSGYTVLSAPGPNEAMACSREFAGTIHLLLTDVIMPGMTGREVAEQLRRERPDLRVLYMSGYTENAIAHRGVLDNGVNYLQKPFTSHTLAEKVRQVLHA